MKKKLLIVIPSFSIGGAQRFCINICKYLPELGVECEVAVLRNIQPNEKSLKQEFIDNEILTHELKETKAFKAVRKLIKLERKLKPDVVLSTVNNVDFWVAVASVFYNSPRLIMRKANVDFNTSKMDYWILKSRLPYKRADKIIVLTEQMKDIYTKKFGFQEKYQVINNMVDIDYIQMQSEKKNKELNKFVCEGMVRFVHVGRMVPEKRHDLLIEAFNQVAKNNKNCVLYIIGSGVQEKKIKSSVPECMKDRIIFWGAQTNVFPIMKSADVMLLTSDYEGFPNVIIEGYACGLPVIATDCPTGPREIIKDGVTGYVVPCGDAKAIAKKMQRLIDSSEIRYKMKKNVLEEVKKYAPAHIAGMYKKIIDEVSR